MAERTTHNTGNISAAAWDGVSLKTLMSIEGIEDILALELNKLIDSHDISHLSDSILTFLPKPKGDGSFKTLRPIEIESLFIKIINRIAN